MKKHCTQNNTDCETCSLVNYRRDCQNNPTTTTYEQLFGETPDAAIKLDNDRFNAMVQAGKDTGCQPLFALGISGTPGKKS